MPTNKILAPPLIWLGLPLRTQPQLSMSDEIRTLIEEGLTKKYPELVEMVKKELERDDGNIT